MGRLIDLTGQQFGRLTVIKRVEDHITSGGNPKVMWKCKCNCGNEVVVCSADLRLKHTTSCGCWNSERAKLPKYYNRKEPQYDLDSYDYGIGYINDKDYFIFDKEDYDIIKGRSWHIHHGYVTASGRTDIDNTEDEIYMHRLVMNNPDKQFDVDHINHNKNDNRKCNLRIATRLQNNRNCKLQSNNTSGVTGVKWHKRDSIWEVMIRVNYKNIYIGRFKNFDDAVKARKEAEKNILANGHMIIV